VLACYRLLAANRHFNKKMYYFFKNAVLWDVAPCRSCVNRRFGGMYRCSRLLTLVTRSRIFLPRRWRRYVPLKRRFTQDLHGATSQKTAFFIVTAVKTSNLTCIIIIIIIIKDLVELFFIDARQLLMLFIGTFTYYPKLYLLIMFYNSCFLIIKM
jgi:hypothetical protein